MDRNLAKKILKIALAVYIVSFLVFNWSDVSWIFNYRVIYSIADDFFNPYPSIGSEEINALFYPNQSHVNLDIEISAYKPTFTEKQKMLEIPKLDLQVPIIFPENSDKKTVTKTLDSGVVYYPGSVLPGKQGQIVILGHSAPRGWPKIKYDWAFNDLDKLSPGDSVFVDLNNQQYEYRVRETMIINRGAEVPESAVLAGNNTLILITCWPPGKDSKRMVVIAELRIN